MELKFETLEKECKVCAEEFIEDLKLLTVFLNYYSDVRMKWLFEVGLMSSEISKIDKVVELYSKQKVELENKLKPQTREEVIKIEDELLRKMFVGKILKIHNVKNPKTIAEFLVRSQYRDCAIIDSEQLEKLEKITLFSQHSKKFPMHFLIFDPDNLKIITIEAISE